MYMCIGLTMFIQCSPCRFSLEDMCPTPKLTFHTYNVHVAQHNSILNVVVMNCRYVRFLKELGQTCVVVSKHLRPWVPVYPWTVSARDTCLLRLRHCPVPAARVPRCPLQHPRDRHLSGTTPRSCRQWWTVGTSGEADFRLNARICVGNTRHETYRHIRSRLTYLSENCIETVCWL